MAATSKKRKCNAVSGGPFKSQPPEVVLTPTPAPFNTILVVEMEGDVGGSSPAPTARVQVVTAQMATPVTNAEAPSTKPHTVSPEASTPVIVTTNTSTRGATSSTPALPIEESPLGPDSWLLRPSPEGDYLLGGVPPTDLEYLQKNLSPVNPPAIILILPIGPLVFLSS